MRMRERTRLALLHGYVIFFLAILSSRRTSAVKTPHTLAEERHLEESLANRMIQQEDLKENRHLTELLGADHLFNNANSLLVDTASNNDENDDASFAVGYDDNDDVEARNIFGSPAAKKKSTVRATKKDKLSETPEEALKSIGFSVDNDQSSDAITMIADSPDMLLKPKEKLEEAAAKKTTLTNGGGDKRKTKEKSSATSSSTSSSSSESKLKTGGKEKSPYEELYDEHEMKAVKETLVSRRMIYKTRVEVQTMYSVGRC